MKTRKAVLAAGLMAGLAAVPLTASAADTQAAPQGSATASTVSLQVSLAPIASTVNGAGVLSQLASAFETLKGVLCPTSPVGCDLTLPSTLPKTLTVHVAQANASAVYNADATDVAGGHSDATPVSTDWQVLNADISALETELTNLIQGGASQLASGGVTGLTNFLSSNGPGKLTLTTPLGTADLHILGSVAANLNQNGASNQAEDTANAVRIKLDGSLPTQVQNTLVSVDPFQADALNAASTAPSGATGPQVSAANTSVGIKLPALTVNGVNAASLTALSAELKSLVNALSSAIADPGSAGNILSNVPGVPAPLQGTLSTIGGLVNQTLGTATGAVPAAPVSTPIDINALKTWDANLSAALDGVNTLSSALANLPDVTNLVTSTGNIATAKTAPLAGGGVTATATATLGALSVLPIGGSLSGLLSTAGLKGVDATTPLLAIDGVTSSARAEVGPGTTTPVGTGGIQGVSVLGQHIDLGSTLGLTPGQSITKTIGVSGLGYLTLRISEGVPQVVADTASYRAVNMAELDVELINGCAGETCSNVLPLPGGSNAAAPHTAATGGAAQTGVSQLGDDGDVVRVALSDTTAAASTSGGGPCTGPTCSPGCTGSNCSGAIGNPPPCGSACPDTAITSLPKTGMLGGAAIPAGLLLMAVAISLRVAPGLRTRLRRMR